ncbi:hypothetical protein PHSY_003754 [Pseudozyma hubeiensis SY62]|uniref:Uncharacterized protein n=1 Tax=Pseudozyma hubeiensis (strain SY62) TaxID=1305764 RepID=R9P4E3_PSEHS|nr:hypothetical protein PHSY_003754 [Pseudozyma hubeiensis SY62]GAC96174.1 hypothetical protein PHSY_003754 [Pseudozyma hubeiensis SY62]
MQAGRRSSLTTQKIHSVPSGATRCTTTSYGDCFMEWSFVSQSDCLLSVGVRSVKKSSYLVDNVDERAAASRAEDEKDTLYQCLALGCEVCLCGTMRVNCKDMWKRFRH